jgi:hypothetical protein
VTTKKIQLGVPRKHVVLSPDGSPLFEQPTQLVLPPASSAVPNIVERVVVISGKSYPVQDGRVTYGGVQYTYVGEDALLAKGRGGATILEGNVICDKVPKAASIKCSGSMLMVGNNSLESLAVAGDLTFAGGKDGETLNVTAGIKAGNIVSSGSVDCILGGIEATGLLQTVGSDMHSISAFKGIDVGELKAAGSVKAGGSITSRTTISASSIDSGGYVIAESDITSGGAIFANGNVESKQGRITARGPGKNLWSIESIAGGVTAMNGITAPEGIHAHGSIESKNGDMKTARALSDNGWGTLKEKHVAKPHEIYRPSEKLV